jgi:hypothetical protein
VSGFADVVIDVFGCGEHPKAKSRNPSSASKTFEGRLLSAHLALI